MSIQGLRKGSDAELNVTPLIDVLLVLLIIFMVMQPSPQRAKTGRAGDPANRELGERAEIPQPTPKTAAPPDGNIVVQLKDSGPGSPPALKVNAEEVSWSDLELRLRKIYEARADKTAFVTGDPEVEFEYVAQAVDISHRAGADRVGLMRALRQ
jgi:biopolymer transport protein TolR